MPVNDSSQKGQAGGGSQDPEPVRELLRLLVKTSKAMRLYQEGSTVPTRLQADLFSRLSSYLEKAGALALDISEFELRLGEESVYESNDPKNSLAFLLFRDGIYRISLNPGLQEKELQGLLSWFNRVAWVRVLALRQQLVKLTLKGRQALFELFMDFNRAAHAGAHPSLEKRSFTMYSSSSFLPILAFLLCSFVQGAETMHINASRLESLLSSLSEFGKNPEGGVSRLSFSEEDRAARAWVIEKMKEAGLEVWVDPAANIHGRRPGSDPSLPVILFGSHIDSAPQGGNFDGGLGSMAALEVMLSLHDQQRVTRHTLEMVIWSDEEGVRYGRPYIGSRAATRGLEPGGLELKDEQGVSLAESLRRFGLDPEQIGAAQMDPDEIAGYLELHIEQGAVLEQRGVQIGIVQGIVGIDEFHVSVEGMANHSGTTPMEQRRDAMVATAHLILAVREEVMARPGRQVGNVGWVQVLPGAPNVVPGLVHMNIELRDIRRGVIDDMITRIYARADSIADENQVSISFKRHASDEPAPTDPRLQDLIEKVAKRAGFSTLRMPSGAGHDAQSLGYFGIPIGMIFVPSKGGISHSPREWTDWDDCARGAEVLYRAVLEMDRE